MIEDVAMEGPNNGIERIKSNFYGLMRRHLDGIPLGPGDRLTMDLHHLKSTVMQVHWVTHGGVVGDDNLWSMTSFYADGGPVYKGLLPGRKKDKLGLAFAYAQMSPSMLSQASAAGLNGGSFESVAELSYSCVITPSVALQPDL